MSSASLVSFWSPNFAKATTLILSTGFTTPLDFTSSIDSSELVFPISISSFSSNKKKKKNVEKMFKLLVCLCLCVFFKGMGKGSSSESESGSKADNRDAYLQLSVTVLAAFCRVPEIASSKDMSLKIPLILEIMSNE